MAGLSDVADFDAYAEAVAGALGHLDRARPMKDYCTGLLLPGDRKSVEPMAALVAPERVSGEHQSLLHLVGQSAWSDEAVLARVRDLVLPSFAAHGGIEAWIVDDTGFAKKGVHSVGVARQYSGRLGKTDNCQIAVSLSVANHVASLPVAFRLYLPQGWAEDRERRKKAGVPEDVGFASKPEIALAQIAAAKASGIAPGVVLADAAYGSGAPFRDGVAALGLRYCVDVKETLTARLAGGAGGRGTVKALALALPAEAWTATTWREGTNAPLASRFAALRVAPGEAAEEGGTAQWLLAEWPEGAPEPARHWLSTLPETTPLQVLADTAKMRWRIERDYEELKSELGLAHYEGRSWRGFHHHATLCIAAYGFLVRRRAAFPPSGPGLRKKPRLSKPPPKRSSPAKARTPRRQLHRDPPQIHRSGDGKVAPEMPLLPVQQNNEKTKCLFMTQ